MMTDELSPEQEAVASALDGALLVAASAGSGKTTTLAERIARLLRLGVDPAAILAITFTNKAGRELAAKIAIRAGRPIPWVGTLHGVGARLLRQHWRADFVVLDDADAKSLFRRICRDRGYLADLTIEGAGKREETDLCDRAYEEMTGARERGRGLDWILENSIASPHVDLCERAWDSYLRALSELRALDFCAILETVLGVAMRDPSLARRFAYLQVDEYQDTNVVQDAIVVQLGGATGNVCAVGDEKQSIYGWRGAEIDNFRRFPERWAGCRRLSLSVNYRSRPEICAAAERLMKSATDLSYPTAVRPHRAGQGGVLAYVAATAEEEAARVVRRIAQLRDKGVRLSECAVLYRAHLLSLPVERYLIQAGIPYKVSGGLGLLQRAAARDLIAYLRLGARPDDDTAFDRAVKAPSRGLGPAALQAAREAYPDGPMLGALTMSCGRPDVLKKAARAGAIAFAGLISSLAGLTAAESLEKILDGSGLLASDRPQAEREATREVADELARLAAGGLSVELLLEQVALQSGEDDDLDADRVTLGTIHGSKGREWRIVFSIGWDAGTFPSPRSDLEEERRLAYVVITRARDELYVGWPRSRRDGGDREPSPFLAEAGLLTA